ncbi:MAG: sigma-70 family RNA polymerase sigma factor [Planctomycetota bacterium]
MDATTHPWLDADQLQRARAGDQASLGALLQRARRPLLAIIQRQVGRRLRHHIDVDDLLQSVYLQVLVSLESFRSECPRAFSAWLTRMLVRDIADRARAVRREYGVSEPVACSDCLIDPRPTPATHAQIKDELAVVLERLRGLPEAYQGILNLHADPAQTHKDSAVQLGRSEGASRVLLLRARNELRQRLARRPSPCR